MHRALKASVDWLVCGSFGARSTYDSLNHLESIKYMGLMLDLNQLNISRSLNHLNHFESLYWPGLSFGACSMNLKV